MNRKNFIKSIGILSLGLVIPIKLQATEEFDDSYLGKLKQLVKNNNNWLPFIMVTKEDSYNKKELISYLSLKNNILKYHLDEDCEGFSMEKDGCLGKFCEHIYKKVKR